MIQFLNPVDPDAPHITAEAKLSLARSENGGLKQPMQLPTSSLVFRVPDSEPVLGYTPVIEAEGLTSLVPGSAMRAMVRFVGVPAREVWDGRRFLLWHGRDVGTATVEKLIRS